MLTKADISALRQGDDLVVHLTKDQATARVAKRNRPTDENPFAQDVYHELTATVALHGYRGKNEIASGAAKCFAMVSFYHNQHTHISAVVKMLRVGDVVTFRFHPDYHTNGYCAAAGLHADVMTLEIRRADKLYAVFEIDSCICPANSARMCSGIPNSEHYESDAVAARKIA